jgi:hypothetical protein
MKLFEAYRQKQQLKREALALLLIMLPVIRLHFEDWEQRLRQEQESDG